MLGRNAAEPLSGKRCKGIAAARGLQANHAAAGGGRADRSEPVGSVRKAEEKVAASDERDDSRAKELERENLDLKIANRGKDYLIDQLKDERNGFFDQLLTASRKVGELENRLLQLEGPAKKQNNTFSFK